jgi:ABC-2 type transport system permease protein
MNRALFIQTWRSQWVKVLLVCGALGIWGALMPTIYGAFGAQMRRFIDSGIVPKELFEFGGGNVFTIQGAIALGFVHPIAIALNMVFAVAFAISAVAGERQRGTLEVLLSRPLSRRTVYVTLAVAVLLFIALTQASFLAGAVVGSTLAGVSGELNLSNVPTAWLNGVLLFASFGAISLAASVSFDRVSPAAGLVLAFVIVEYFLFVLGTLWHDAAWLQRFSLFDYADAKNVLAGTADRFDFVLLAVVTTLGVAFALAVFPRRDLAAPS